MDVTTISEAPWRVSPPWPSCSVALLSWRRGFVRLRRKQGVLRDRDALGWMRGFRLAVVGLCLVGIGVAWAGQASGCSSPPRASWAKRCWDERHHRNPQAPSSTDGVLKVGWGHGVVYRGHPYCQVRGCEMPDEAVMKSGVEPVGRTRLASELRALGVRPGEVVMVHARVSALGWVVGGTGAVVPPARRARIGRDADGLRRLGG